MFGMFLQVIKDFTETLIEKHKGMMMKLSCSITGNYHDAEDVVQDVLQTLSQKQDILKDLDSDNAKNYIYTVTRNRAVNFCIKNSRENVTIHEDVKYTFLPYKRGLFHIFTAKNIDAFDNDFPGKFLETFFEINDDFRIGISSSKGGCTVFRDALRESVYANISCIIYEKVMLNFNATGINRILCPASVTENLKRYYSSLDILINKACSEIGSEELKKTLTEYVICNGDIPAVSKKTHQHPNTIRYRISKVKDVWECENELDFQTEITMYIRTGQILNLLV